MATVMRTPTKRKGQGTVQVAEAAGDSPNKRHCGSNDLFDDSQSYVEAVLSKASVTVQADVHRDDDTLSQLLQSSQESDATQHLCGLISKLSSDIHNMFETVNEKVDKMANDIEKRLSNKFSQMLDKRLNSEMGKIRKEVRKEVEGVKEDIKSDIRCLQSQLDEQSARPARPSSSETDLNLVIRNLPETEGENLGRKVEGLLRDGLKLRNVSFASVNRKAGRRDGKPGVVIMTCKSYEEKEQIMAKKKTLKGSRNFTDIFIHPDQSYESRLQATNFKTLLSAIQAEVPGLRLQGTRLVRDRSSSRDQHYQRGGRIDGTGQREDRDRHRGRDGDRHPSGANNRGAYSGRPHQQGDYSGRQRTFGRQSGSQGNSHRDQRKDGHSK